MIMAFNFGKEIGAEGMMAAATVLDSPAEEFVNDALIEELWAMKAFEHAEIYFNLLSSLDPKDLRLTKLDDELYAHFRKSFPELSVESFKQEELKSAEAKEIWRSFCDTYNGLIEDYNFGTLIRLDCSKDYSEANTIIVPRVQFLAIELARNREGLNGSIKENFKPKRFQSRP